MNPENPWTPNVNAGLRQNASTHCMTVDFETPGNDGVSFYV